MGHFSYSCYLTGLPITGSTPVAIFPIKMRKKLYDNSEEELRKYGKSTLLSNEGARVKFVPMTFPIFGKYDEYGGVDDIIKDDNTKVLEDYYGLTIEEIVGILTSGRKSDGFDGALKVIKEPIEYPADWVKGERHFDRYQRIMKDVMPPYPDSPSGKFRVKRDGKMVETTKEEYDADIKLVHEHYARYQEWTKTNPDIEDDYNKPNYQERYKELLSYSVMWIHGDVYQQLTNDPKGDWYDKLDLGTPGLLKSLGFVENKKKKGDERYNRVFEKDGFQVYSDGTWLQMSTKEGVYNLIQLQKALAKHGVSIDISNHAKKGRVEQIYDYVMPEYDYLIKPAKKIDLAEVTKNLEESTEPATLEQLFELFGVTTIAELADIMGVGNDADFSRGRMAEQLRYYFLNEDRYSASNPHTEPYFQCAKKGGLKDNLIRFWIFDSYMYDMGKYYDIIGTSPQDGEHASVLKVLETAVNVLKPIVEERKSWEEDEEDYEE